MAASGDCGEGAASVGAVAGGESVGAPTGAGVVWLVVSLIWVTLPSVRYSDVVRVFYNRIC